MWQCGNTVSHCRQDAERSSLVYQEAMATAGTSTTPEGNEEMESEEVGKTLMGQFTAAMLQGTKDQLQTYLWNQEAVLEAGKACFVV